MRDLRYGIEIEMTGLSRGKAAETLAGFFGTRAEHTGGSYDAYAVRDAQDRVWKLVSDGSIQAQKKVRGQTVYADSTYSGTSRILWPARRSSSTKPCRWT